MTSAGDWGTRPMGRSTTAAEPMTAEQRARFDSDGYMIIRDALAPDEVAAARDAVPVSSGSRSFGWFQVRPMSSVGPPWTFLHVGELQRWTVTLAAQASAAMGGAQPGRGMRQNG